MEPQQQQQQQPHNQHAPNEDGGSSTGKGGNFLCRQSSTRWTPTSDQIRILKDLYYNNGVRSPTAEEIQRISARLRQYGKIEGKNVFYWFQNHKARERQKKRLNADVPMQRSNVTTAWKSKDNTATNNFHKYSSNYNNPGMSASASASSANVFSTVGQMGEYGYGSVPMERSFRECSLSAGGNIDNGGSTINHNIGWTGFDPYASYYTLFDMTKPNTEEDREEEAAPEIETLPLFPMHNEGGINSFCSSKPAGAATTDHGYITSWYHSTTSGDVNGSSLELSLNSYSCMGYSRDYF